MSENISNQKSDAGAPWARIKIGSEGCFSANETALEFYPDDSEKTPVKVFSGETEQEFFIEKSEAEAFLKKIIELGRKPEVSSRSRRTTAYQAEAEWRNLTFIESEISGSLSAFSNEWTTAEIVEALPQIEDAEIAGKLRRLLDKGLHRPAIEICLETEKLLKRLVSPPEKV